MTEIMALPEAELITTDQEPDWHLAQVLHAQHVPLREICQRANVGERALDKRVQRENWVSKRDQAKAIVSVTVKQTHNSQTVEVQLPEPKSQEGSNLLLQRLQKRLDAITQGWDSQKPPKSIVAQSGALELLDKATSIGKVLWGWGNGGGSSSVDIRLLQSAQGTPIQPVLDVQSSVAPAPIESTLPAVDVPGTVQSRD